MTGTSRAMKKQALIPAFALAAAMVLSPHGISAAADAGRGGGGQVADGAVYAGISPETHKPLYPTPADAPGVYTYDQARKYCRELQAFGHKDWHAPARRELNVLWENRNKGKLAGTFNETGLYPAGWYWTSLPYFGYDAGWAQRFSDGLQDDLGRFNDSSLRYVR